MGRKRADWPLAAGRQPEKRSGEASVLSRRDFLISATATGIALAFARPGAAVAATPARVAATFEPSIWYAIDTDGLVTLHVAEAELGQHVGTALARILAEELEASWDSIRLNYVDTDPKWGTMLTGGSWSVWSNFEILSRAGAAGRIALIEAGAKLLKVPEHTCTARDSVITSGSKSITYAQIVSSGTLSRRFTPEELEKLSLKAPRQPTIDREGRPGDRRAPPKSMVPESTESMHASKACSMRVPSFLRRASDRERFRSTTAQRSRSRATPACARWTTRPASYPAGSWCTATPSPLRAKLRTLCASSGARARRRRYPSSTCSTTRSN